MKPGVYKHKKRDDLRYLFIGLAQDHDSHEEYVVYVPLFNRSGWKDKPIMTLRSINDFKANFEWMGERQPDD